MFYCYKLPLQNCCRKKMDHSQSISQTRHLHLDDENRATQFRPLSLSSPQMCAFHLAWLSLFTGSGVSQLLMPHIYTWKMNLWQMSSSIAWLLSFLVPGIFQGEMARGRRRDGEMERQQRWERVRRRQQKFFLSLFIKRGSTWDPLLAMSSTLTVSVSVEGLKVDFLRKLCLF